MLGSSTKAIVAGIGMILVVLNAFEGQNVFPPNVQQWIGLVIAVLTPLGVYLAKNANMPALQPGDVVVNRSQIVPGAKIVAQHKP